MTLEARLRQKHYHLKQNYGISLEDYKEKLESQDFRCAICGKTLEENKKDFSVDHNHSTGTVRGLFCQRCNMSIGLLEEDVNLIASVIDYLIKHDERFEWTEETEFPQMERTSHFNTLR